MCVGMVFVGIIKDAGVLDERVPIEFKREQGSWIGTVSDLAGEYYIIVETESINTEE